jgi:large subunit ribosomal protein L28
MIDMGFEAWGKKPFTFLGDLGNSKGPGFLSRRGFGGNFGGPWARLEGRIDMSRTCDICGKHTVTGNKVSHAKNRTRRTWKPNLIKVKTEIGGTALTLKICARCLKSDIITKKI